MRHAQPALLAAILAAASLAPALAQAPAASAGGSASSAPRPCTSVTVDKPTQLTLGKSHVVQLPFPVSRVIVGGAPGSRAGRPMPAQPQALPPGMPPGMRLPGMPEAPTQPGEAQHGVAEADVTLLGPTELYFLGRRPGSMNVVLQGNDGRCLVKDLVVAIDPGTLQAQLAELLPGEKGIQVRGASDSIVLTGTVSNTARLDQVLTLAGAYGESRKLVNLLSVTAPQQVMLEVKIAEVSKTLLDRFGLDFSRVIRSGSRFAVASGVIGGRPGAFGTIHPRPNRNGEFDVPDSFPLAELINSANGASRFLLDLEKQDGIFRVLAEPNIMAISGQAASFLSGGKIFIPVAQAPAIGGGSTITLEEKEFGVGLKFTPTVLDGRINLKLVSEVSELSQTGTPFTSIGGVTAILPSLTTRRVDTTVQLADGQSLVVAGLIKNNVTEALNKFPGLGEAPVVGALFRSTEFQNDQTELMFVVTPRLVTPLMGPITVPTDNHVVPSRSDVILNGRGEGEQPAPVAPPPRPVAPPLPVGPRGNGP
jgi:pilus assembly protein CpaC